MLEKSLKIVSATLNASRLPVKPYSQFPKLFELHVGTGKVDHKIDTLKLVRFNKRILLTFIRTSNNNKLIHI